MLWRASSRLATVFDNTEPNVPSLCPCTTATPRCFTLQSLCVYVCALQPLNTEYNYYRNFVIKLLFSLSLSLSFSFCSLTPADGEKGKAQERFDLYIPYLSQPASCCSTACLNRLYLSLFLWFTAEIVSNHHFSFIWCHHAIVFVQQRRNYFSFLFHCWSHII